MKVKKNHLDLRIISNLRIHEQQNFSDQLNHQIIQLKMFVNKQKIKYKYCL